MRALQRAWQRITEPRRLKVIYLFIYMVTAWVGVVTLLRPPQTIAGEIGPIVTLVWASLFVLGGVAGLVSVLPGWWWVERLLCLTPIGLGLLIYAIVVSVLHVQGAREGAPGIGIILLIRGEDAGSSRLTQIGIILLASAPFILRAPLIQGYSYEPRR